MNQMLYHYKNMKIKDRKAPDDHCEVIFLHVLH